MVSNKSRLLRLYRYLYANTDDRHYTTKAEIMDALKDDESIYSRQTVRDDIDTLSKEGYDIETIVSSGNFYYFGDREFTLEELRMLGDAILSYRFIGKKQKAVLLKKLRGFCSKYQADTVKRHLISVEPSAAADAQVYGKVNLINDAINRGCKMGFQLREPGNRRKLADGGRVFSCTPMSLVWDGREFYLIALPDADKEEEPVLHPLAGIVKPVLLEEKGLPWPAGFKAEDFASRKLASRS